LISSSIDATSAVVITTVRAPAGAPSAATCSRARDGSEIDEVSVGVGVLARTELSLTVLVSARANVPRRRAGRRIARLCRPCGRDRPSTCFARSATQN
jgi:hypothetical protein